MPCPADGEGPAGNTARDPPTVTLLSQDHDRRLPSRPSHEWVIRRLLRRKSRTIPERHAGGADKTGGGSRKKRPGPLAFRRSHAREAVTAQNVRASLTRSAVFAVPAREPGPRSMPQGSQAGCGTSRQVRFMSPWEIRPSPSRRRATDRQVLPAPGGPGRRANATGSSSPPAVQPSARFTKSSTHARVTPVHAQDLAPSVNQRAAAHPSGCHWQCVLRPSVASRNSRTASWPVSSKSRLEQVAHRALRQCGASL